VVVEASDAPAAGDDRLKLPGVLQGGNCTENERTAGVT
jgi:hypothetical protein